MDAPESQLTQIDRVTYLEKVTRKSLLAVFIQKSGKLAGNGGKDFPPMYLGARCNG
jgi:hypothetical protein